MALMCDPQLLIADEPTTALDVTVQAQILRLLADLQRDLGLGMLLITHDLGIVARVATASRSCTRARWSRARRPRELFADPKHPYTQGLLRCVPVPGKSAPRRAAGLDPRHGAAHRPGLRGLRLPRALRLRRRDLRPRRPAPARERRATTILCRLPGMSAPRPRPRSKSAASARPSASRAACWARTAMSWRSTTSPSPCRPAACWASWANRAAASPRSRA